VNYCPACGAPNDENARFCVECNTRLLTSTRADPKSSGERLVVRTAPAAPRARPGQTQRLAIVSAVTGLLGLGPIAIALGWLAIHRRLPGRQFAWAGVGLGSAATLAAIVLLVSSLGRGDPLARMAVTPDNLNRFSSLVTERCDRIEEQAAALRRRLGPDGASEVAACYALINSIREDLFDMVVLEDPAELAEAKDEVMDKLDRARVAVEGW
jgi:hypothetical protein